MTKLKFWYLVQTIGVSTLDLIWEILTPVLQNKTNKQTKNPMISTDGSKCWEVIDNWRDHIF